MTLRAKRSPLIRKSATFPFQIAAVCWVDLLGYGAMIAEADFNPLHPKAAEALSRLRRFHQIVAAHSSRYFPTLAMNDGAAAYRDLSFRSRAPTHDFLMRAWNLFNAIKSEENERALPGARMVLAAGFRLRGRRAGMDAMAKQFKSLMRRYQEGAIVAEQAIREAANVRRSFDIVPQLQANFAFSKAYVAERSGTRGGLKGPNFFVDLTLFETPVPAWIETGETVKWSDDRLRMKASFAPILGFPPYKHVEGGPAGIRDGLQIAQDLTQDVDVLNALRAAEKPR